MAIKFSAIVPHPPIVIPSIGQGQEPLKTVNGLKEISQRFKKEKPETLILISPHGVINPLSFTIYDSLFFKDYDLKTNIDFENNLNLVNEIKLESDKLGISVQVSDVKTLDHGATVPLYYLEKEHKNFSLVPVVFSCLDIKSHFEFGQLIGKILDKYNAAIVASGDLSHRLLPQAPAGYSKKAKEFDQTLISLLKEKQIEKIINLDQELIDEAGECGYRSIVILLGAINHLNWKFDMVSYEFPFGVGYLTAQLCIL